MSGEDGFPPLREEDVATDPLDQFRAWFDAAREAGVRLPETMILATATADGVPSARAVLLKGVEGGAFLFFTNHESRKARELAENPRAALTFYWDALGRQVRVEGAVERLADAEAEAYFRTRPLGSRIGTWASPQSQVIPSRAELETRVREAEARFPDGDVPLPAFWGGYRLVPHAIEFWQGRPSRLHDRILYTRQPDGSWLRQRLSP